METQQILGDRYELRRRIGVGGMASVFLAHDLRLDRDVAVKVLDMAGVTDRTFVERFRREARAAAAINHPNVVAVYDWGESGDTVDGTPPIYYLVMEYVPGPNLKEKVQRDGPLSEAEALRVAGQVASALEAAHARGLIHRDIKSQNVLIDPSGNAKVADFGIAHLEGLTHLTQTNAVSGSAHYISPEQAQGQHLDARSDIYSLGIVLYELLTGRLPFDGESLIDVALHHVRDEPLSVRSLQPGISTTTELLVARALKKDPSERFARAADLRTALERARADLAVQTARSRQYSGEGLEVERVTRAAPQPDSAASTATRENTVKLGAAVPVHRPRVRHTTERSRWWILAVPVLALVLIAGGIAAHALSSGGSTSAPPRVPTGQTKTAPHRTSHTVSRATPAPTRVPVTATRTAATPVPTTAPAPLVSGPNPTSTIAVGTGAPSPERAVTGFYDLVTHHRYAAAAALWSSTMKANYPPSTNIYGRFDQTQAMTVRITHVSQQANTATVDLVLAEQKTDGTVSGFAGSWNLIRGSSGWLLDSVTLSPVQVSPGASSHDKGKHNGNEGNGGNG